MTEPQTITTDHVRALLAAQSGAIVAIEGRIDVVDTDQLASDDYRGAFEVITRDELIERVGPDPSDEHLHEQAEALTVAVQSIGG
jgi:hypothetical protein